MKTKKHRSKNTKKNKNKKEMFELALCGPSQKIPTCVHSLHTCNNIQVMVGVGTLKRLKNIEVVEQHG